MEKVEYKKYKWKEDSWASIRTIETNAWIEFVCSIIAGHNFSVLQAAKQADDLMVEFRKRFMEGEI